MLPTMQMAILMFRNEYQTKLFFICRQGMDARQTRIYKVSGCLGAFAKISDGKTTKAA